LGCREFRFWLKFAGQYNVDVSSDFCIPVDLQRVQKNAGNMAGDIEKPG
jgi:hypothetical protein